MRKSGGGVDGVSNTVHPVSLYVSSLASKPRFKKPEKIHGDWGFNGESPHRVSDPEIDPIAGEQL